MLVEIYRDNAIKKTAVYKWVKRFSEGRESVTDEERSGRPATSRTEEKIANIPQIVRDNIVVLWPYSLRIFLVVKHYIVVSNA